MGFRQSCGRMYRNVQKNSVVLAALSAAFRNEAASCEVSFRMGSRRIDTKHGVLIQVTLVDKEFKDSTYCLVE